MHYFRKTSLLTFILKLSYFIHCPFCVREFHDTQTQLLSKASLKKRESRFQNPPDRWQSGLLIRPYGLQWHALSDREKTDCSKDHIGANIEQYKRENVIDETAHGKRFQCLTTQYTKPFSFIGFARFDGAALMMIFLVLALWET